MIPKNSMTLESALKTITSLKERVKTLYNTEELSPVHKQLKHIQKRQAENNLKRELTEARNEELKKYTAQLEGEVARRIETSKTILNNVTFGFLLVNQQMIVQEEFTKSCQTLFGTPILAGKTLPAILGMPPREAQNYIVLAEQVFEDILPEELSVSQLPQRFVVDNRIIKVEGSAVRDKAGTVTGMLYSISDISDLEAAQRESNTNRMLITLVKEMDAFVAFIDDSKELLQNSAQALKKGDRGAVRRALHTIKGNSYSYGLSDIGDLVHKIEEEQTISLSHLKSIESAFKQFLDQNYKILELKFDDTEKRIYEVSSNQVNQLQQIISQVKDPQVARLKTWVGAVTQKQATTLLGPVAEFTLKLASRLGKKIEFKFEGAQVLLDYDTMKPVCQSLIHLIRNSIDHGIEPTEERGSKSQTGQLRLTVMDEKSEYVIEVSDDGRGINTQRLLDSAIQKQLMTPEKAAKMNHTEQLNLIFAEGLSSAERITDISGRGMGMSAVLEPVKALGGRIDIQSEIGKGTKFTVRVPKPSLANGNERKLRIAA